MNSSPPSAPPRPIPLVELLKRLANSQHQVARLVAVLVIDFLEIVQVHQHHNQRMSPPFRPGDLRLQPLLRKSAVVQTRKRIEHSQPAEYLCLNMLLFHFALQPAHFYMLVDRLRRERQHQNHQRAYRNAIIHSQDRFHSHPLQRRRK
jgi:hypothetical protein